MPVSPARWVSIPEALVDALLAARSPAAVAFAQRELAAAVTLRRDRAASRPYAQSGTPECCTSPRPAPA